jgi:hypothetical protein
MTGPTFLQPHGQSWNPRNLAGRNRVVALSLTERHFEFGDAGCHGHSAIGALFREANESRPEVHSTEAQGQIRIDYFESCSNKQSGERACLFVARINQNPDRP